MRDLNARFLVAALTLAGLAALGQSQVKLSVKVGKRSMGTCEFSYSMLPGGSMRQTMQMKMSLGGRSVSYTSVDVYSKDARPISQVETKSDNGVEREVVKQTFGTTGVTVVRTAGGKSETKTIPFPKGASVVERSIFWFINVKPQKGQTDRYTSFHSTNMTWESESVTYVADKPFKVGGKTVVGHELKHKEGSIWLDDKGYPVRIELQNAGGTMIMERI